MVTEDEHHVLTSVVLINVTDQDSGGYVCDAGNSIGRSSAVAWLSVSEKKPCE